jgi:hypothetical protein
MFLPFSSLCLALNPQDQNKQCQLEVILPFPKTLDYFLEQKLSFEKALTLRI